MNVNDVLRTFNEERVDCLLIGGINCLLRHEPVVTFDIDRWVVPSPDSLRRCEKALTALDAARGPNRSRVATGA